ncbi:MAG: EFR1 family ferrodoxin [Bacteroidales bacterium]|nr:EFR1 family ferrodoxin [Bacteroidales bacterium]
MAKWMASVSKEYQVECQPLNIAQIDRKALAAPEPDTLIIFLSPIHGFNYPPIMLNFIMRFPKGKNKVVLMNTRAGMLIGKFITPDLQALLLPFGFDFVPERVHDKGYSGVDMPSNWISVHPGLNDRTVKFLHEKNKERVEKFAHKIMQGKSHFKHLIEVYDILLAPIALGYYLAGRFFLAKTYYASADCDNCGLCIKACPVKGVKMIGNRPFWTFNCESCMKCMSNCPKSHRNRSWIYFRRCPCFPLSYLVLFYKYFNAWFFPIENAMLKIVVESVLLVAFIGIWYRLVHWLLRYKVPERLTVYTSLTKYKWWGRRYKALKADFSIKSDFDKTKM